MHELSIAQSLLAAVLQELERLGPGARLRSVRVATGRLHQLVPDSLRLGYELSARETRAEGSALVIREVPVAARCRACGWSGGIEVPLFLCGACGSGDLELTSGRELFLENLEIDWNEQPEHPSVSGPDGRE